MNRRDFMYAAAGLFAGAALAVPASLEPGDPDAGQAAAHVRFQRYPGARWTASHRRSEGRVRAVVACYGGA